MTAFYYFALLALLGAGCQKKPNLAPAIDPLSALAPPPMGATTYNDSLKKELALLEKLLEQKVDAKILNNIKDALLNGHKKGPWSDNSEEAYLINIYLALPELVHIKQDLTANQKLWYKSKFLFLRRRFIEAATLMSELLEKEPSMSVARNWRARALFFLGNPDMAIRELQKIVSQEPEASPDSLDALYLIGAITYESDDREAARIKPGIKAWNKYLKLADAEPALSKEITASLKELEQRLKGEAPVITQAPDIYVPNNSYSPQKNEILKAFNSEELLLAQKLCEQALGEKYDKDLAIIKARIFIKSGRIDEAAELFKQITEKDKSYAPGFHYQGMAFMMKGQIKEAITSWEQALKLDPAYAKSHNLEQRVAVAQNMLK